jgi:glutamine synthetase adenylyltransferase
MLLKAESGEELTYSSDANVIFIATAPPRTYRLKR